MSCPDLLLERDPGNHALGAVLADVFRVAVSAVAIVDGLGLVGDSAGPEAALVVQRHPLQGAARLLVRVFAPESLVDAMDGAEADALGWVRRIAAGLRSSVLVEDGTLDPSGYLRIGPDGAVERITLDDDRLSDADFVQLLPAVPVQGGTRPPARRPSRRVRASS